MYIFRLEQKKTNKIILINMNKKYTYLRMYSFFYRLRERFDWALWSIFLILESGFFAHGRYFAIESTNVEKIQNFHSQFLRLSVEVCFILKHFSCVFSNFKSFSYFWHCMFWKKHLLALYFLLRAFLEALFTFSQIPIMTIKN